MANYHTEFSLFVGGLTPEERAWLEVKLKENNEEGDDLPGTYYTEDGFAAFSYEFENEASLWIYSDESGICKYVADVLGEFLAQFRPNDSIGFEWANTCDKPRLDTFGGGAVFITAEETEWMGSGQWLAEKESEFKKRKEGRQ